VFLNHLDSISLSNQYLNNDLVVGHLIIGEKYGDMTLDKALVYRDKIKSLKYKIRFGLGHPSK
jgi:hypothetical protein